MMKNAIGSKAMIVYLLTFMPKLEMHVFIMLYVFLKVNIKSLKSFLYGLSNLNQDESAHRKIAGLFILLKLN